MPGQNKKEMKNQLFCRSSVIVIYILSIRLKIMMWYHKIKISR